MQQTGKVYFIREVNGDLKVGTSLHPEKRLIQGQVWNPRKLELVGTIQGGKKEESYCHTLLADKCIHGEWFRYDEWTHAVTTLILQGKTYDEIYCRILAEDLF
jgi:hypothetical protein